MVRAYNKSKKSRMAGGLSALLAVVAGFAPFAASAVDWQFTGATNRTAAVTRTCVISSEFDSQIPSTVRLSGYNMRSDAVGTLILFR